MAHWTLLGIEPTPDERAVKRAYAKQLKRTHPEDDPEGFQALRAAYEAALDHARYLNAAAYVPEENNTPDAPSLIALPSHAEHTALSKTHVLVEIADVTAEPEYAAPDVYAVWDQAGTLLQELADLGQRYDEALLTTTLKQWLSDDTLLNMDLRLAFEERLLHWLAHMEPLPPLFAEAVVELFNWHDSVRHLSDESVNAWLYLWERMLVLRGRDYLDRMAESGVGYGLQRDSKPAVWVRCARQLRSPYSRWRFHWAAISNEVKDAMGALLNHLAQQTPGTLETLDPQTVAWWQRAVTWPRIGGVQIVVALILTTLIVVSLSSAVDWVWCKSFGTSPTLCGSEAGRIWVYIGLLLVMMATTLAAVLVIQHQTRRWLVPRIRGHWIDPARAWIYSLEPRQKTHYWLTWVALTMVAAELLPDSWRLLAFVLYAASILQRMHFYLQFLIWVVASVLAISLDKHGLGLGLEYATWVMICHFVLLLAVGAVWKKLASRQA